MTGGFVRAFCLAVLLLHVSIGQSALPVGQQFAQADWFSRPLAPGVSWNYYYFDDLFSGPQNIAYIEADLDTPGVSVEMPFRNGLIKTTNLIKTDYPGAAGGINGTFFRVGGTATYVRSNGVDARIADTWGNWGYQAGLVYNQNSKTGRVIARPVNTGGAATAVQDWRTLIGQYTDIMVNGPMLVRNGNKTPGLYDIGSHCTARHPRSMVGMKPGNVLMLVVADGRHPGMAVGLTCDEMADVMIALGCTSAVSLDGGGSTLLYGRGEPFEGILNFPSDNGGWDRDPKDQRSVANAIAVTGSEPIPLAYDARVQIVSPTSVPTGELRYVQFRVTNIGSATWNNQRISITTARPAKRASEFYSESTWIDSGTAYRMPVGQTVTPGQTVIMYVPLKGPSVPAEATLSEFFQLTLDGTTRIGPPDNEIQVTTKVIPSEEQLIVESRQGGKNYAWYSDNGMANSAVDSTAPGATAGIGMRYGSTFTSVAGSKSAHWKPVFPQAGFYRVRVAWGAAGLRRSGITYHVNHAGGTSTFRVDQTATANEWVELGERAFEFAAGGGAGQGVEMTNEHLNLSGSMYAGPVWFEYVGTSSVGGWELY